MSSKKILFGSCLLEGDNVDENAHDDEKVIYYDSAEGLARALVQYLIENDIEDRKDDDF